MKAWIAVLAMVTAAGASAQTQGEIGRKAGAEVGHRIVGERPAAGRPFSVMLSDDQLVVLIVGLDGQEKRSASLDTAASRRRGSIAVVGRGVSTTLEVWPGPKGGAAVRYTMEVEESGLARLSSSRPETGAAQIINAFMDFWINAPRSLCPKDHVERCLPLNFPL